ncbi:Oligo-1,6-glucosidase [Mycoplasmopsis californica]|uniref:Glycosyl hydrolase family 13 catalytic domain-containing protein n=1 Tax=Mycoplasmopsis equigenitalium TaxID=114883 RepID=A0ABY5J2B5_9BACT|nr:hypothetical protein [Mycoplasmopsis equigenitalium]UUD36918.1 hypothetical protein NPA09_03400 [Mycoplasmopsis equigenitalium]VEU69787.1 Oligo-1,6-glucosidase [Mycoplasmopsis californica]
MKRYYKIQPSLFFDSNNSGFGDYNGVIQKINVISKLDLTYVILPNPLSIYKSSFIEEIVSNENKYGTFEDFKNLIENLNKNKLKSLIEIDLSKINEIIVWYNNLQDRFQINKNDVVAKEYADIDKTESFYISENTYVLPFAKQVNEQGQKFLEILHYFLDLGVYGFVFKDFSEEKINNNHNWIEFLKSVYGDLKTLNELTSIIFEVPLNKLRQLKYLRGAIFDDILITQINNLTKHNFVRKIKKVIKADCIINLTHLNHNRVLRTLFSNYYLNTEISKLLLGLVLLIKEKQFIYFGDEIGLNLFSEAEPEFSVDMFLKNFFKPKNQKLVFTWNSNENSGFSDARDIVGIYDQSYKNNNHKVQRNEPNSTLHFYKKLITFSNNETYQKLLKNARIKVTGFFNLLKIKIIGLDYSIIIFANLDIRKKYVKKFDTQNMIFSNYNIDIKTIKNKNFINPYEIVAYIDNPYFKDELIW